MTRIDTRRAVTVGLGSLAALTLLPLLADARPGERAVLLIAAVPAAALLGYLAGYAAAPLDRRDPAPVVVPRTASGRTRPTPPRAGRTPVPPGGDADHHQRPGTRAG